jgi:hypothetical protein
VSSSLKVSFIFVSHFSTKMLNQKYKTKNFVSGTNM